MIQRFEPKSPIKTTSHYEVYRNRNSTQEQFQHINQLYKRIMTEDKDLCESTQKNLVDGSVFVSGEMHPQLEKGPLHFQKLCRETLMEHHRREEKEKHEIWPARQTLPSQADVSQEDVEFCKSLACDSVVQTKLEW